MRLPGLTARARSAVSGRSPYRLWCRPWRCLAVLAFIFSFQVFTVIYLTTGGGPGTDTSTLAVLIYNQAFEFFNYNYATAIAVIALILALSATLVYVVFERMVIRNRYLESANTAL